MSATQRFDYREWLSTTKLWSDGARLFREVRRALGMSGDLFGPNGEARAALSYSYASAVVVAGVFCAMNVASAVHEQPQRGPGLPLLLEGSSWFSFALFLWVAWKAYCVAPLTIRPRWKLLIHLPAALLFSSAHVAGFVALRKVAYWFAGSHYDFGPFLPGFFYEFSRDACAYSLFLAGNSLVASILRANRSTAPEHRRTYDIQDGSKLSRVALDEILAIQSAGNYVEFVLCDGRKLLLRSSLSAIEKDLGPQGFLRTHRSWIVNSKKLTALKPAGSGDYVLELGATVVPLSRRFPQALAQLRSAAFL